MKVLVTGGAGYIGSVLIRELLKNNHEVKCLDRFFFGKESLKEVEKDIEIIDGDTRTFDSRILKDVSAVVDLAAISQPDPEGFIDQTKFYDMNYFGSLRVSNLSKLSGVERYIFPSTCSIYGSQGKVVDETSPLDLLDLYTKTKNLAEKAAMSLFDDDFCVTSMRFSTVYGLSPRMRFDLVLNIMTLSIFKTVTPQRLGNKFNFNSSSSRSTFAGISLTDTLPSL
jgi:nucleoside-diphosphate-sugar epimerase